MSGEGTGREQLTIVAASRLPRRLRLRRWLSNAVIIVVLAVIAIDAAPWINTFHGDLKDRIDPALDVTGTWQGPWDLFSPSPDSLNERLFATVEYTDGSTRAWSSPDWRSQSALERFTSFRELEFYDQAAAAGPEILGRLADHIVASIDSPPESAVVVKVTIEVGRRQILDPTDDFAPLDAYLDFPDREVIHVERFR